MDPRDAHLNEQSEAKVCHNTITTDDLFPAALEAQRRSVSAIFKLAELCELRRIKEIRAIADMRIRQMEGKTMTFDEGYIALMKKDAETKAILWRIAERAKLMLLSNNPEQDRDRLKALVAELDKMTGVTA